MIRYCEEEVELNDMGHFRVEIDTESNPEDANTKSQALHPEGSETGNFNQTQMILEVELMFSDLLNHGGPEKFSLQTTQKEVEEKVEFKSVAFQKFMLRNVCDGIYEYVPITFDESHFCVTLATVHSVLMDFRFRSQKLLAQFVTKGDVKEKIDQKKARDEERKRRRNQQESKKYLGPTNLTEYLFADKYGEISNNINASEIN